MEVPNLVKEDLICLLASNDAALHEAIDKVRPNLKTNLSDTELKLLRRFLVNLRSAYKTRYAVAGKSKSRFKEKYSSWLKTNFLLPICLLQDCLNDSGSAPGEGLTNCANCKKELNEYSRGDPDLERSFEKTFQAFQVVFEGLLKLNNVKLSANLPELCSNCESLLLSLHESYVDFMNLTVPQSPVSVLLGRSIVWKNRSKPETASNSRLSVQPRNRRKSLKAIQASEVKLQKQDQELEPESEVYEDSTNELTHQDSNSSNAVEPDDPIIIKPEEPKAEIRRSVVITQSSQPRLESRHVKQALGFDCLRCSTTFMGHNGFMKHRRSNHTIFPEPHYRIMPNPNKNTQIPVIPTIVVVGEQNIGEYCALPEASRLTTVDNIDECHGAEQISGKMDAEQVISEVSVNSMKIGKRRTRKECLEERRKHGRKISTFWSIPSIQAINKRPKSNQSSRAPVVSRYKTRQSKKIVKKQRCPYCDEIFEGHRAINAHVISHLPNLNPNPQQTNLKPAVLHVTTHYPKISEEGSSSLSCPECSKTYTTRRSYRRHLKWHKIQFGPDFPCPHCGDLLKGTQLLLNHIRMFHMATRWTMNKEIRPFVCPYKPCITGYRGITENGLKAHINKLHADLKDNSRAFQCDACTSAYRDQETLDRHKTIRHTHHPCHLCDKSFNSKRSLTCHLQHVHIPLDESQLIQCEICGVKSRNKSSLKNHLLTHQPDRKPGNLCDLCGKRYFTPEILRKHISIVHEGIKKYVCPHCGVSFGTPEVMKNHVRAKHEPSTGPGYPCTICGKVFKLKTYLYQHSISKVHGGPGLSRSKRREKAKREESEQGPQLEQVSI